MPCSQFEHNFYAILICTLIIIRRNIDMDLKKAKLDDDSFIYAKRDEKSTKEKWQEMNFKEKLRFFRDYYLLKLILIAVIVVLLGKLLWDTFGPKPTEILNIGIDSYSYLLEDFEIMQDELMEHMELDPEESSLRLDTNYDLNNDQNSVQRISLYLMTGELDGLITTEKHFTGYIEKGAMAPLKDVLPADLFESLSEKHFIGHVVDKELDGTINSIESDEVYGIYLDHLPLFSKFVEREDKPIFGIPASGVDKENAITFLRFLLDNYAE